MRAAGAGARPAQPPPQGTAHEPRVGTAGWGPPLRGTDRQHKLETLTRDADQVYGAALHPGKWGSALGTRTGCSVPPLASAPAVFGSREGHPAACQGLTVEGGDSEECGMSQLLTLLQQLKVRVERASGVQVRFIGGRRDR